MPGEGKNIKIQKSSFIARQWDTRAGVVIAVDMCEKEPV